jgi:hypothetical protein
MSAGDTWEARHSSEYRLGGEPEYAVQSPPA